VGKRQKKTWLSKKKIIEVPKWGSGAYKIKKIMGWAALHILG